MEEILLTVDTSSSCGSVALSRGETLLGEVLLNVRSNHTDRLLVTARQLLDDVGLTIEDVDAFAVVRGPGAFTGLRVGMGTVKGLALATGKPVVPVSSLATLALQSAGTSLPVCALLDARKKEVYAGLFRWEGGRPVALGPEVVRPPEALLAEMDDEYLFVGDGALAYRTLVVRQLGSRAHFLPWPGDLPRASSAAVLALDALRNGEAIPLEQLTPCYIRLSEAEIMWAKRQEDASIEG